MLNSILFCLQVYAEHEPQAIKIIHLRYICDEKHNRQKYDDNNDEILQLIIILSILVLSL